MSNQLENSSQSPSLRRHRLQKFFPLEEVQENQLTAKLTTTSANGHRTKPRNGMYRSSTVGRELTPWEQADLEEQSTRPWRRIEQTEFESFGLDSNDGPWATTNVMPVVVVQGISNKQSQSGSAYVENSEISGAASDAGFVGIANIAGYAFRYGNTILIQRGLGAGLYGLYTLGMAVVSLVSSLFNLGLDDAMVRYISIYRVKKQTHLLRGLTIFCTVLAGVAGLIGALLLIYFAPALADFLQKPELTPVLMLLSPMIPLTSMVTIWSSGLQGFRDFKKRVLLSRIFLPTIGFIFMGIALIFFRNMTGIVIMTLLGTMFGTVGNFYFLFLRVSRIRDTEHKPKSEEYALREWVGFATPNFLTSIIGVVLDSIDSLLLGYFAVSNVAIGQYGAAVKVTALIAMPLTSLNTMFAPTIAELYSKGEKQKLEALFKIVTKWAIVFSLPIFMVTTLFSVPLLALSGESFVPAWPLVIAFALGGLVSAGTGSVGYMLLMTGHVKVSFLNSLAAVIVNIVLGIILTPRYGAMGTAIATGLAIAVVNVMRLLQVRLFIKMQPYRWDTLKPFVAAIVSGLFTGSLLILLNSEHWSIRLFHIHLSIQLLLVPVFLAGYVWLLSLFKISPEDRVVLDRLSKKFKRSKKRV